MVPDSSSEQLLADIIMQDARTIVQAEIFPLVFLLPEKNYPG